MDAHDASPSAATAATKHRRNISIRSLLFFIPEHPDARLVKDTAVYVLCKIPKQYTNTLSPSAGRLFSNRCVVNVSKNSKTAYWTLVQWHWGGGSLPSSRFPL